MLKKVEEYILKNKLFTKDDLLLLAVSGGTDSMAMCSALHVLGYTFIICHCNFKLRGKESDSEEAFIKDSYSETHKIIIKSFDTKRYASEKKISIEMAAREQRYNWFQEILKETGAKYICTAHNANDSVETTLLNLTRGTGLKGITGIQASRDNIRRPLLSCTRSEIVKYNEANLVEYKTDSSNNESIYTRNKFRNSIIPQISEINPRFIDTMIENSNRFESVFKVYQKHITLLQKELFVIEKDICKINYKSLFDLIEDVNILFDVLQPYNFTLDTVYQIFNNDIKEKGKYFSSISHIITYKENHFEISNLTSSIQQTDIPDINSVNEQNDFYKVSEVNSDEIILDKEDSIYFDLEKLTFPLHFRKWKNGDKIKLVGMHGRKKISDLFSTDNLHNVTKAEKQVLLCGDDIIWAIGKRVNSNFCATPKTKKALRILFHKAF